MDRELYCSVCGERIYDGDEYYDFTGIIKNPSADELSEDDCCCECCLHDKFRHILKTDCEE